MPARTSAPYSNYNFTVAWGGDSEDQSVGGFSDVSGLSTEITVAEYRTGNHPNKFVQKVPGIQKSGDVTLKRGVINQTDMWAWINDVRANSYDSKRNVVITMKNEAGDADVKKWTLKSCLPLKWTGPTLAGKGGGDVAMEELTLSVESLLEGDEP